MNFTRNPPTERKREQSASPMSRKRRRIDLEPLQDFLLDELEAILWEVADAGLLFGVFLALKHYSGINFGPSSHQFLRCRGCLGIIAAHVDRLHRCFEVFRNIFEATIDDDTGNDYYVFDECAQAIQNLAQTISDMRF